MFSPKEFKRRCKRVYYGFDTFNELMLWYTDRAALKFGARTRLYRNSHFKRLVRTFTDGNIYRIRDVILPRMTGDDEKLFWNYIYEDTFSVYVYFNEDYSEKVVNLCDDLCLEGAYGLVNDRVNVTVKPGDVVIDAGAWIGVFAAYASVKGAKVYAFEPAAATFETLRKTAELNGNITPVNKGLSDENTDITFFVRSASNSGANTLCSGAGWQDAPTTQVQTVRLDDFVRENNITRVDFIKCDIEGFERHMLAGAQEVLARFAPKLALCTYHLPDDPQVMAELILKANPKYNIVQKSHKLYASVPE